jgi:hypothetical protein
MLTEVLRTTRRDVLRGVLGLASASLFAPRDALALARPDVRLAQLRTSGTWNPRPDAIRRLLWEVAQRTSIEVDLEVPSFDATDPALFKHPFVYWSGAGAFSSLEEEGVRRLRRFITYGGTMLIDSADADPGGGFDTSVRRELARVLPGAKLDRLPNEHVIYKSFYLVDHQGGRTLRVPYIESIRLEKREAIMYCQNDLGGAWARDAFGRWEYQVTPGGERQREMTFRLGINILMYALCLDYKEDLVHAPFILKRRR